MATTNKRLCAAGLTATMAIYYTVPAGTRTILGALTLCNTGGSACAVTVQIGGVSLLFQRSIEPGETLALTVPHCLEAGHTIEAVEVTTGGIEMIASGVEIS
jgi:hypothetical protein